MLSTPAENYPAFARKVRLVAEEMIEFEADESFGARHLLNDLARLAATDTARSTFATAAAALRRSRQATNALPAGDTDEAQDAIDDAVERDWEAMNMLMATPAPDIASLSEKLELMAEEDSTNWTTAPLYLLAMRSDGVRLAAGVPIPPEGAAGPDWVSARAHYDDAADALLLDENAENVSAELAALHQLFVTPAPNPAALAYKFGRAHRFNGDIDRASIDERAAAIANDANRLAGIA